MPLFLFEGNFDQNQGRILKKESRSGGFRMSDLFESLCDFFSGDIEVRRVKNTFALIDEQGLRRFVMYAISFGNLIGDRTVRDQIQIVRNNRFFVKFPRSFEPHFCHITDAATGAVFKNQTRRLMRPLPYLF